MFFKKNQDTTPTYIDCDFITNSLNSQLFDFFTKYNTYIVQKRQLHVIAGVSNRNLCFYFFKLFIFFLQYKPFIDFLRIDKQPNESVDRTRYLSEVMVIGYALNDLTFKHVRFGSFYLFSYFLEFIHQYSNSF